MNPWQIEIERRLSVMEDKLTGHPSTSPITPFDQKIERLIAYFEKHARENEKRAEKIEKSRTEAFHQFDKAIKMDRSSYYLSGKADTYARAAEKVRELLEPEYPAMFGGKPKTATEAVMMEPFEDYNKPSPKVVWDAKIGRTRLKIKTDEKWVVDAEDHGSWRRSQDVPQEFSSEFAATQAMAEADHRFWISVQRRARRIE